MNKILYLSGDGIPGKGLGKIYHKHFHNNSKNFLYVRGVELIGLGPTGMIFYITPTLQFILGYFYYNEEFSLIKFLSFIIIWIAVIIYLNDLYETN